MSDFRPLPDDVLQALQAVLGERLSTAEVEGAAHAHDVSHHVPQPPAAVAWPLTTEEVAAAVKVCHAARIPVIPFGTGTAVEGGVVATQGGLCIDLRRMNRIVRVSPADADVTVEAGVTRLQLNRHLAEQHAADPASPALYFPVDPGADASLGGMASTNASGSAAVRYGTMRSQVLGLTVVLPDGCVIHTGGRARKSSAGYHLTGLFVGAEGTLGIITEVTLRLHHVPEAIAAAVCPFPDIDAAVQAAMATLSAGIDVARLELLDATLMAAVNRYSGLAYAVTPTLFFEFHGSAAAVRDASLAAGRVAAAHGGGEFQWATEPADRNRLWQARYDAYYACLALRPNSVGYATDVCVPVSNLAECIRRTQRRLAGTQLPAPLFGHVGDGNFHVALVLERGNARELAEARELGQAIVHDALDLQGTCTGEHGIGLGKREALRQECGAAINVMLAIKQALDPHGIMNPGKVLKTD